MQNVILSIVVPVYNAEKYLEHTIELLVEQTVCSIIEIILVNDGSSDNSLSICKRFAELYKNIKVIDQKNSGVSVARNVGVKAARGRYIAFMDSDDSVDLDYYEKMLGLIQNHDADIAIGDFEMIHPDGYKKKYRGAMCREWNESTEALIAFFSGYIGNNVFDKIFRADVLQNVDFPIGYKIGEDMFFVYQVLKKSNTVILDSNVYGYHYWIRDNSAMTGEFNEKYFDTLKLSKIIYRECEENIYLNGYAEAHMVHESCKVLEYIYKHGAENDYREEVNKIIFYIKEFPLFTMRKFLKNRQFYGFLLMRFSPKLYMYAHKIMRIG